MNKYQTKCYDLIREYVDPGSTVLEISCGEGQILQALKDKGYAVYGTNFSQYDETLKDIEIRVGVDVRKRLPFTDQSVDCVLLSDVIEHISDHDAAIAEISRVLRTGGVAVILTPNTNRLSSRIHYLCTGFLKVKRAFIGFDAPPDKAFVFHN